MPTLAEVPAIVAEVREQLAVAAEPGVRASDHAGIMSKIERSLRSNGKSNVLLVPTLDD